MNSTNNRLKSRKKKNVQVYNIALTWSERSRRYLMGFNPLMRVQQLDYSISYPQNF